MFRLKNYLFGKPEAISYRISQVVTLKRPYPLVKLLLTYSDGAIEQRRRDTDPFYHWRATIHQEIRSQLQNLALLESYYKHHEPIPSETPEGLPMPKFRLDVKASQIRGAGKGLFISQGSVKTGQVICCYPGLSYFYVCQGYVDQYGLNLRWPRGARDHILTLEGQVWIDANPRLSIVSHSQKNHMWAKGHYINHPTQGFAPNVVPAIFDYGPDFVSEACKEFRNHLGQKKINLERFVPNEFAWEFARMESEWIPGAVFVALRDIEEGEEIFYDYEWEHNINFIQYSQRGDILIDWPWYQTVPQETVNQLIEPWLSYRDFIGETNKDWRLTKTDTIHISPSKETLKINGKETKQKDEQLLLEGSEPGSGKLARIFNGDLVKGLFGGGFKSNAGWGGGDYSTRMGWVDDNVEPVPKEKVTPSKPKRRSKKLIKKSDEISLDEEDIKLTKRKMINKEK